MKTALLTIAAVTALAIVYVLLPVFTYAFQIYRQKKVLKCPEAAVLAEVDIDAPRAALSRVFGKHLLRVKNCSLWPKRKGCGQGCLKGGETV
jgi:hypothetical protein